MSIESDFKEALFSYFGEAPGDGIVDNEIIRFGKHKEFWYVFHSDNIPCGVFGNWKTGDKIKWSSGARTTTTDADRLDMKRIIEANTKARELALENAHEQAHKKALSIVSQCSLSSDHDYLTRKSINPEMILVHYGVLIIPIIDINGSLVNLQTITPDGTKRFFKGGKVKGCFHAIGFNNVEVKEILICEGYATGESLYEVAKVPVVVSFSAGNLLSVANAIRVKYPKARIVICGDNDKNGVGQKAANEAAKACNGLVAIPALEGTDFNDVVAGLKRGERLGEFRLNAVNVSKKEWSLKDKREWAKKQPKLSSLDKKRLLKAKK